MWKRCLESLSSLLNNWLCIYSIVLLLNTTLPIPHYQSYTTYLILVHCKTALKLCKVKQAWFFCNYKYFPTLLYYLHQDCVQCNKSSHFLATSEKIQPYFSHKWDWFQPRTFPQSWHHCSGNLQQQLFQGKRSRPILQKMSLLLQLHHQGVSIYKMFINCLIRYIVIIHYKTIKP